MKMAVPHDCRQSQKCCSVFFAVLRYCVFPNTVQIVLGKRRQDKTLHFKSSHSNVDTLNSQEHRQWDMRQMPRTPMLINQPCAKEDWSGEKPPQKTSRQKFVGSNRKLSE